MKILLTLFLLVNLVVAGLFDSDPKEISFEIRDVNGHTYHIKDKADGLDIKELKGKVVFLAFFGHRCPPCMMEVPELISFTNDPNYKNKAVILAFEVQGLPRYRLQEFIQYKGINYNVVPGLKYKQFIDYIGYRTGWNFGIPFMVVLDTNGKVVNYGNGVVSKEELMDLTNQLYVDKNSTTQKTTSVPVVPIQAQNNENKKEKEKSQSHSRVDDLLKMISGSN